MFHVELFPESRSSRRGFLQASALPLALGLAGSASQALVARAEEAAPRKRSLIVFWTDGGLSQQDSYDLKPGAPAEYRGTYSPINTAVPGLVVGERLAGQAQVMQHVSVVRSVHHENGIHAPSAHWMQTGYFGPTLARNAPQKPSLGSVIARSHSSSTTIQPLNSIDFR